MDIYIYIHTHTHIYICVCVCVCVYIQTHIHTHTHTYVLKYICIHTQIRMDNSRDRSKLISKAVRLCLWVFYFPWEGYQPIRKTPILGGTVCLSYSSFSLTVCPAWEALQVPAGLAREVIEARKPPPHTPRKGGDIRGRLPKHALNYKPRGRRDRGRPRKRWQRVDAGTGQST